MELGHRRGLIGVHLNYVELHRKIFSSRPMHMTTNLEHQNVKAVDPKWNLSHQEG
jgi:hypothetical protein